MWYTWHCALYSYWLGFGQQSICLLTNCWRRRRATVCGPVWQINCCPRHSQQLFCYILINLITRFRGIWRHLSAVFFNCQSSSYSLTVKMLNLFSSEEYSYCFTGHNICFGSTLNLKKNFFISLLKNCFGWFP